MIENNKNKFIDEKGKIKLEILLMCQNKNNITMEKINQKFNEISNTNF